jgi:hypothetical protein
MEEARSTDNQPLLKLTTLPVILGDGVVVVRLFGGTMAEELNEIAVQSLGMHVSGPQKNRTSEQLERSRNGGAKNTSLRREKESCRWTL